MNQDSDFQTFLDAISDCFIARDFASWQARIIMPFSMITLKGPRVFETETELLDNFNHYLNACDILHIDMIYRKPLSLERSHDGTLIGTYETSLLSNGKRVTPPYTSSAMLETTSEGLKVRSILNARGHQDWTGSTA